MNKYLHGFFVMALETDTPKLEPVPAFLSFVPDLCARWKMSDHCVAGNWGYHNGGFSPSILKISLDFSAKHLGFQKIPD